MKPRLGSLAIVGAATLMFSTGARADDYVSVRGAYYREASTRVIQPMVEVIRESPSGLDVGAHFLVDAITSASIAAGTSVDNVFTEVRDEVGLRVRKRWQRSDAISFVQVQFGVGLLVPRSRRVLRRALLGGHRGHPPVARPQLRHDDQQGGE